MALQGAFADFGDCRQCLVLLVSPAGNFSHLEKGDEQLVAVRIVGAHQACGTAEEIEGIRWQNIAIHVRVKGQDTVVMEPQSATHRTLVAGCIEQVPGARQQGGNLAQLFVIEIHARKHQQRRYHARIVVSEGVFGHLHAFLRQCHGALALVVGIVDFHQHGVDLVAQRRLVLQILFQARGAGIQHVDHALFQHAGATAVGATGIEQADQVILDGVGTLRFFGGALCLPQADAGTGQHREHRQQQAGAGQTVAPDPAGKAITEAIRSRHHRPAVQMALDIIGQGLGAAITARRIRRQRAHRDGVQIAPELRGGDRGLRAFRDRMGLRGAGGRVTAMMQIAVTLGGQQFEQDRSEAVDIGGGTDLAAIELFGRGITGAGETVDGGGAVGGFALQDLRDAEIQQAGRFIGLHDHVAGLDIAMDHQLAVGMRDRAAQRNEQHQARFQRRIPQQPLVQRLAFHMTHRVPGPAGGIHATVDQMRDAGMFQPRHQIPFAVECGQHGGAVHAGPDHLQRDMLYEGAIGALGQPDAAHAARAQPAQHAPRADHHVRMQRVCGCLVAVGAGGGGQQCDRDLVDVGIQQRVPGRVQCQQPMQFITQRRVFGTGLIHEGRPRGRFQFEHLAQCADAGKAHALSVMCRRSRARAARQSRATVRSDRSSSCAISENPRPAKKCSSTTCASRAS